MVHMYHEIGEPYAFLWRLRPALRKGGQVIVVDGDRPIAQHGTPFLLLVCEFQALGYKLVPYDVKQHAGGYLARFQPPGKRPPPQAFNVSDHHIQERISPGAEKIVARRLKREWC